MNIREISKPQWMRIGIAAGIFLMVVALLLTLTLCTRKDKAEPQPPSREEVFLADANHTITVYDHGELKQMPIEDYLPGVLAQEMPLSFDEEALKAQAIAARTYTIRKLRDGGCGRDGADICTDHTHCQAYTSNIPAEYADKVYAAVQGTRGEVLFYQNEPIKAMYHSSAGDKTEDNQAVFGDPLPYLISVDSPGEQKYSFYQKRVSVSLEEAKHKVKELRGDLTKETIVIRERNASGRVQEADLFGHYMLGVQVRNLFDLPSTNFTVSRSGNTYTFTCIGYGHGVGMSQTGADAMANRGATYQEILQHYYAGAELKKMYE